jgi:hypothetical protein
MSQDSDSEDAALPMCIDGGTQGIAQSLHNLKAGLSEFNGLVPVVSQEGNGEDKRAALWTQIAKLVVEGGEGNVKKVQVLVEALFKAQEPFRRDTGDEAPATKGDIKQVYEEIKKAAGAAAARPQGGSWAAVAARHTP